MDRHTPEDWEIIKQAIGPEQAAAWLASGQIEVGPLMTNAAASATPAQGAPQSRVAMDETMNPTGGLGGTAPSMAAQSPIDELQSLAQQRMAFAKEQEAERKRQFDLGQQYIQQNYRTPSVSDRLWALSQALLAPRPYRGFAGTMANVTQALAPMEQQRRAAEKQRAEALLRLQQTYGAGVLEDKAKALEARYDIAKARAELAAKKAETERKASEPEYSYDSTLGKFVLKPGTGGLPPIDGNGNYVVSTPEQAAQVPAGATYVFKGNPNAAFTRR